ncbi:MAG: hypothetical protein ABJ084_05755 [Halioglobus sp.]
MINFELKPARVQAPLPLLSFHKWTMPDGSLWMEFFRSPAGYILRFSGLADFEVSLDGTSVFGYPSPGVEEATSEHLYLNQVLPLAMSKMGTLVFHASAVAINGGAVAFLGESGRGKSTLAASFATNGYSFLTDDGLVLNVEENGYSVSPSHPSIRLWEDSRQALVPAEAMVGPKVSFTNKVKFLADKNIVFCREKCPLTRVYFLGNSSSSTPTIRPMAPTEARIELVRHSFLLDVKDKSLLADQFNLMSRHAHDRIFYRLDFPKCYKSLPEVRQVIIDHAACSAHDDLP